MHTNLLSAIINLNNEVLPYDAHPVHHFYDAFTPITVLLPLNEEISHVILWKKTLMIKSLMMMWLNSKSLILKLLGLPMILSLTL